jgi:hypothetical protein
MRLVKALVASGSLELKEGAELQPLVDAVDEAVTSASQEAFGAEREVAEAILEALVNSPAVEEVFADHDEVIAALRSP